ncbi:MAG: polysaccharide deacetylase family protein [Terriglobales bacterium]
MTDRYVTISVDDGYPADTKVAGLLQKYALQGTFYVPARNSEYPVMTPSQIRELSQQFEVGSHTYNHASLNSLPDEEARTEISSGKEWLEDILGQPVVSFCYPRGKFNRGTAALVEQAGFLGARTCLFNLHGFPKNPFLWGLSTHAGYHSRMIQVRHAFLERNFAGIRNYFGYYRGATDWQIHFLHALDYVEEHGGIAHLYLHSWEIEEFGEWTKLESVLQAISRRSLTRVTNGSLFQLWSRFVKPEVFLVPVA